MRNKQQRRAAETRRLFVEAWDRGVRNEMELSAASGCSVRQIQRLKVELNKGELAEKLARDRREDAAEGGKAPPPTATPPQPGPTAPEPLVDPGPEFDHIGVARALCASNAQAPRDRIRAAEVIERRRQYDLEKGISAGAKGLRLEDWLALQLDDIPPAARPRTFGLLAATMAEQRTPWLSQAETTAAQVRVWHLLGLQVPAEDAAELVLLVEPVLAAARERAAALVAERKPPPPDSNPIQLDDYVDHVPGAPDRADQETIKARVRELTTRGSGSDGS